MQDPRDPRGVRHSVPSVLLIAVVAVLAGAPNLPAIAERAADLSQEQLRLLGAWQHPRSGLRVAPSYGTLSRVIHGVDAAELDRLVGGRPAPGRYRPRAAWPGWRSTARCCAALSPRAGSCACCKRCCTSLG